LQLRPEQAEVKLAVGELFVLPLAESIVTSNQASTAWMRLARVRVELPANSRPTGLFPDCVTIKEPESPPALKVPPPIANWFTYLADFTQNGPIAA
jgi:hypothetical protein